MNNEIVIVITSPVDGVYKKIKLPFYINSVRSYLNNGIHILGSYDSSSTYKYHYSIEKLMYNIA